MAGSQDFEPDPRNQAVQIYLNGAFVPKAKAMVSIFDAGWMLGDGIWEGLRMHGGRLAFLNRHIERLFQSASGIGLEIGMTRADIKDAIFATLEQNNMTGAEGVHVRLMITRGLKAAANQDPRNVISGPTVVILAEYKAASDAVLQTGLKLATSSIRCTPPDMFDMTLNTHSRLPYIIALNEAIAAGADEALMLDREGNVSTCNATNFFMVKDGAVVTSTGDACFHGITRANVIEICAREGITCQQKNFDLAQARSADEAFVTGSFGGLTPVASIDDHAMKNVMGPLTTRLRAAYLDYAAWAE